MSLVASFLRSLGLAGWQTQHLHLGEEEVTLTKKDFCATSTMRMPYVQLGSVDVETICCGSCFNVETDGGIIQPKCGCDKDLVDEISEDLQNRKVTRGNIAQVRMQENLMIEVIKLGVQLDQIARKEGVVYPPGQETMTQVFGSGPKQGSQSFQFRRGDTRPLKPMLLGCCFGAPSF